MPVLHPPIRSSVFSISVRSTFTHSTHLVCEHSGLQECFRVPLKGNSCGIGTRTWQESWPDSNRSKQTRLVRPCRCFVAVSRGEKRVEMKGVGVREKSRFTLRASSGGRSVYITLLTGQSGKDPRTQNSKNKKVLEGTVTFEK